MAKKKGYEIFSTYLDNETMLIEVYKVAIPEWNNVESIIGYPEISKKTNKYIFDKFIKFDRVFSPNVFPGGTWMNMGFSSLENTVRDFFVDISNIQITWKNA